MPLILPASGLAKPIDVALSAGESAHPELWRDLVVAVPILSAGDPRNVAGRVVCTLQGGATPSITDIGRAVSVDGSANFQRIQVPEPFPQDSSEWAWAVWFDYRGAGGTGVSSIVQSEDGTGTGRQILAVRDNSGAVVLSSTITGVMTTGSATLAAGGRYLAAISKRGSDYALYLSGARDAAFSGTATANAGAAIRIGAQKSGNTAGNLNANILAVYAWRRAVSDVEMRLLGALPAAPFVRRRSLAVPVLGALTSYTLTADTGSVTAAGGDASLAAARTLSAAAGAVAITGSDATLSASGGDRSLAADPGSFTTTGSAATLRASRTLSAAAGDVTASGTAATLVRGYVLPAAGATVAATGQGVVLIWSGAAVPPVTMTLTVRSRTPTLTVTARTPTLTVEDA